MTWLTENELKEKGIKFGKNVRISDSCKINCEELEVDDHCRVDDFCFLSGKIKIGKYVHISVGSILSGTNGITIGNFVGIAPNSYLFTSNDDYVGGRSLTNPTIPKQFVRYITRSKITIKDHAIIGAFSSVFPGSILHEGSAFGSYSIIDGEYDSWKIYSMKRKKVVYRKDRPKEIILEDAKKILSE